MTRNRDRTGRDELNPQIARTTGKRPALWLIGLLILIPFLFYAAIFRNEFTSWDDYSTLAHNPAFNPPTLLRTLAFWFGPHMSLYVPVTYSVWGALCLISYSPTPSAAGLFLSPWPFHLANIALHLVSTVLVFLLLRTILKRGKLQATHSDFASFLAALLFALHPIQVESVAWISGMKDLLYGALSLAALYYYLRAADTEKSKAYAIATLFLVLAMLSKPTAMVVPAIAMLLDWTVLDRTWRKRMTLLAPWFGLAILFAIVARWVQPASAIPQTDVLYRPMVAADSLAFYLRQLIWPARLCVDYGRTPTDVIEQGLIWWTWLFPAGVLAVAWLLRRRWPALLLGLGLFLLPVSPMLGLVPFEFQSYSTVADHYLYLAMFGIALVTAAVLSRIPQLRAIAAILLLAFGVRSTIQIAHWRDTTSLFDHTLSVNPSSAAALSTLASQAQAKGDLDTAISLARRAMELHPRSPSGAMILAAAYRQKGDTKTAERLYRDVVERFPHHSGALASLAGLLAESGNTAEAAQLIDRALKLDESNALAHMNLGIMLAHNGDLVGAESELAESILLSPGNITARINHALVVDALGQKQQAIREIEQVLRMAPNDPRALQAYSEMQKK